MVEYILYLKEKDVAQITVDMAVSIAHTQAALKSLSPKFAAKVRTVVGHYFSLQAHITTACLEQSKEYPNGWLLLFTHRITNATITVLVRDDDRVYFYGISETSELQEITGPNPPRARVEEQYLRPQGQVHAFFPRLSGR